MSKNRSLESFSVNNGHILICQEVKSVKILGIGLKEEVCLGFLDVNNCFKKYGSVKVPIYGSVICGSPEEEEQQNPEYLALPEEWISGDCFLLRAKGDSMTDIGVDDGDLVLVKREYGSPSEYNGKVIVALTEDGNTLKRRFVEDGVPRLHPENRKYEDIYPKRLEMQGLALRVIKQIV